MSTHDGGGGRYVPCGPASRADPVRDRDLALAQTAFTRARAAMRGSSAANGGRPSPFLAAQYHRTKGIFNDLRKGPFAILSPGQRNALVKAAGLTELPPVEDHSVPMSLPKKPPGRVQEPAETEYV